MLTLPTATPKHSTFFSWNLMDALISETYATKREPISHSFATAFAVCANNGPLSAGLALASRLSLCDTSVGNLPALFSPGPSKRGICLITDSDATKAAYFLAAKGESWVSLQPRHLAKFASSVCTDLILTKLLHQLLVLVQLLQVLHSHLIDAQRLGLLTVLMVSKHTNGHLWPRRVRQLDCAAEPLIFLQEYSNKLK